MRRRDSGGDGPGPRMDDVVQGMLSPYRVGFRAKRLIPRGIPVDRLPAHLWPPCLRRGMLVPAPAERLRDPDVQKHVILAEQPVKGCRGLTAHAAGLPPSRSAIFFATKESSSAAVIRQTFGDRRSG